jgi:hypothetical protein
MMVLWLFLLQTVLAAEEAPVEPYLWPLKQSKVLTSSFAEYRPGRFHMGIDLRTGPIGKNVYAAADGHIERIRCSPFGYGKAIYVRFDDGNSAIYAHLNDFIPSLRESIRAVQHQRESYTVDVYPRPGQFPVTRGQLIGYSGQTGIGVPHLHWEIRDKHNHPVNPRSLNIEWPDTTRPIFRKALVVPVGSGSLINGDVLGVELNVRNISDGQWTTDPIYASGSIAFGVDVVDPANRGATKLGVYTIETKSESTPIFFMKHEQVTYTNANDGVVSYHPYYKGRILTQWTWPDNQSELYSHTQSNGIFNTGDESEQVTVTIADFHGHTAELTIPIIPMNQWEHSIPETTNPSHELLFDQFGTELIVTVRLKNPSTEHPVLLESGVPQPATFFRHVGANTYRAKYAPTHDEVFATLGVTHPQMNSGDTPLAHQFLVLRRGHSVPPTEMNQVRISAPEDAVYGRLFLSAAPVEAESSSELTVHGPAYSLWPENAPIDQAITVSLPLPADTRDVQIYRQTPKKWQWIPSRIVEDRVEFDTRTLGVFQIMSDTKPPRLFVRIPMSGITTSDKRPEIKAVIDDPGSTIKSWEIRLDDQWLLTEYDPEQKFMRWEQDEDLPVGEHVLHFSVEDEAGNISKRDVPIVLTETP